jgi:dimethylglycine dehydrogenase
MRLDEDSFFLITAATAQWHDFEVLRDRVPESAAFELTDVTKEFSCQILTGPSSRDILASVSDADLSLGWLTHQSAQIDGTWVQLVRVSFAGELGWEIHSQVADTAKIYDTVLAAGASHGLKPFGMYALNSLRMEKGYRAWKGDLSTDYSMLEGGLARFIKLDKPQDFPGKAAIQNEKQQGVAKSFVTLTLDAPGDCDAPYMSTIWHDGKVVGETTSGAWGYRTNKSIALGMMKPELCVAGTKVVVEIYGEKFDATVQADQPLWDPENARIRA